MSGEAAAEIIQGEGRNFGRYTLLYRFATGGMADVYLARLSGTAGFEKLVAIKAIHPHLGRQPQFIEMFIDEARLASRVSHPNVIHTLELGRVAETHFIAMEYVDGESLSALIRRGRPAPAICARIVADAAAGLHAAHELKGRDGKLLQVVHRDVSPTNILIGYNGAVKVADFGVARAQGMIHSTAEGSIKGKFAYMAPEQLRPEIEVDRRADVFALGIVLFEITTGRHLFRRKDNAATIAEVLHGEIARPSQAPGCQDYPDALERIVVKALQRPVEARYQTAHELQQDLERFIVRSGEPVLQADVGRLMQEVFADRIQEKEQLLCEAERHPQVVPDVETQSGSSMRLASVAKGARPRVLVLVAAGILALSLIVMVVLLLLPEKRPADTLRPPTRVQAAVPADAAVSLDAVGAVARAPDTGPAMVNLEILAAPTSATITIDGKPVSNPFRARIPAREEQVAVEVTAPGHQPQRFPASLNEGGQWRVDLVPIPDAALPAPKVAPKTTPQVKKRRLGNKDVLVNPYR